MSILCSWVALIIFFGSRGFVGFRVRVVFLRVQFFDKVFFGELSFFFYSFFYNSFECGRKNIYNDFLFEFIKYLCYFGSFVCYKLNRNEDVYFYVCFFVRREFVRYGYFLLFLCLVYGKCQKDVWEGGKEKGRSQGWFLDYLAFDFFWFR